MILCNSCTRNPKVDGCLEGKPPRERGECFDYRNKYSKPIINLTSKCLKGTSWNPNRK